MSLGKLPSQYQDRLNQIMWKMIPTFRKAIDTAAEFGVLKMRAPLTLKGYDQEFEIIIRPISDKEPEYVVTDRMIETKAKALYVAFYLGMDGSTKEESEVMWVRLGSGESYSELQAYKGWLACAKEALS